MTSTCSTTTLDQFRQAVASLDIRRHLTPPTYARRKVLAAAGDHCPLCHQAYDHTSPRGFSFPVIATFIHTLLGGPLTVDNLFTCCRRCQQSRSSTDLIALPNLPDALLARRAGVLLLSQNHLLPLPRSTALADYRLALAQRHAMPRSRVYAAQSDDGTCLLGVSHRYGDDQSKGLAHVLAKLTGWPVHKDKRLAVYAMDDNAFRKVAWQLIDANAWVVGVAHRTVARDFLDYWWLTSASVGELRLRKVSGVAVPQAHVVGRQVTASALRARRRTAARLEMQMRQSAAKALEEAEAAMVDSLARHRRQKLAGLPTDAESVANVVRRWAAAVAASAIFSLETLQPQASPTPIAQPEPFHSSSA